MTDPLNAGDRTSSSIPMRSVEDSVPVESSVPRMEETTSTRETIESEPVRQTLPVEPAVVETSPVAPPPVETPVTSEAAVEDLNDLNSPIQLYEERLVTQTQRVKTGEVKISKRIVTGTSSANIPVTKEKIIIEIESIYGGETRLDIGDAETAEDGSIRMDIYEEQALSCREIVPYQNVSVRKEIVADTVTAQETLRREEIEVTTEGSPLVEEKLIEEV